MSIALVQPAGVIAIEVREYPPGDFPALVEADPDLVGYWRLNDGAGSATAVDRLNAHPRRSIGNPITVDGANYCGFPSAVEADDGAIVVAYFAGTVAPGVGGGGKVAVQRSSNEGATWSGRSVVADHTGDGESAGTVGLCKLANGTLILSYVTIESGINRPYVRRSTDHGVSFGAAIPVPNGYGYQDHASLYGPAYEVGNGDLLLPLYGADTEAQWLALGDQGGGAGYSTYVRLIRSTDGGLSWADDGTAIAAGPEGPFTESCIVPTPDGRLLLLNRTHLGSAYRCYGAYSDDDGETWGAPTFLFYACANSPGACVDDDGNIWLATRGPKIGSTSAGHYLMSPDGGASWSVRQQISAVDSVGTWAVRYGDNKIGVLSGEGAILGSDVDLIFYPLEADAVGGDNPGVVTASVTFDEPGLVDSPDAGSVLFSTGRITVPTTPQLERLTGPFTIEAWATLPDVAFQTRKRLAMLYGADTLPAVKIGLEVSDGLVSGGATGKRLSFRVNESVTVVGPVIIPGTLAHIVATYDGTDFNLYLNGARVATAAGQPLTLTGTYPPNAFVIGAHNDGTVPWAEHIAEVAVYADALSTDEVRLHYYRGLEA